MAEPALLKKKLRAGQAAHLIFTAEEGEDITGWTLEARFAEARAADGSIHALPDDVLPVDILDIPDGTFDLILDSDKTFDFAMRGLIHTDIWRIDPGEEFPMASIVWDLQKVVSGTTTTTSTTTTTP